jgi:hypothetical protein
MNRIVKPAAAVGLAGALALAAISPSQARPLGWAAAGIGLAAGAAIAGAAAANAATYPYGYEPGYAYDPYYGSYAYAPGYAGPGTVYAAPGYGYGYGYAPSYSRARHGYDTTYIGPWKERQLEGKDY